MMGGPLRLVLRSGLPMPSDVFLADGTRIQPDGNGCITVDPVSAQSLFRAGWVEAGLLGPFASNTPGESLILDLASGDVFQETAS